MKWVAALALCACNQIYGLDDTKLPPPDAALRPCWEIGGAPYAFADNIFQAFPQRCNDYHFTRDGDAVAMCDGVFATGHFDHALVTSNVAPNDVTSPQLTPDGMRAYLALYESINVAPGAGTRFLSAITMYERVDDKWIDRGEQMIPTIGEPSVFRGTLGPRMIVRAATLEEYELVGGIWERRITHPIGMLGAQKGAFAVTGDGLRAVFPGPNMQMAYTDRQDLTMPFQRVVPLPGVPFVQRAQLTEDCGRVYYAGTSSVFFSQQQP